MSNYGNILIDLNKFEEANVILNKAIQIAPDHKDATKLLDLIGAKDKAVNQTKRININDANNINNSNGLAALTFKDQEAASDWLNLAAIAQREQSKRSPHVCTKITEAQPDLSAAYKLAGGVIRNE